MLKSYQNMRDARIVFTDEAGRMYGTYQLSCLKDADYSLDSEPTKTSVSPWVSKPGLLTSASL
jgi:hypothetical protein